MRANHHSSSHKPGYLLLEVTLALLISAIILGTTFKIAQWNLAVSNDSIENSNAHMKQAAFFSFFDRAFLELPGDAQIELREVETSTHYLSELTIQNAGDVFSWPNQPFTPRAIKIVTKPNQDKTIDIVLEYYSDYLLSDPRVTQNQLVDPDQDPIQSLILLDDIFMFEWGAWNGRSFDRDRQPIWIYEWEQRNLPRYFSLKSKFELETEEVAHVFWLPQKVNPDQFFTQTLNSRGNTRTPDNANGTTQDGTSNPEQ